MESSVSFFKNGFKKNYMRITPGGKIVKRVPFRLTNRLVGSMIEKM